MTQATAAQHHSRLAHMPVSLFSIVMGLVGTTLALQRMEALYGWSVTPSLWLLIASAVVYVLIAIAYLAKYLGHRREVIGEFNHPIRLSFFPTMSIGLILLASALVNLEPPLAEILWLIGIGAQLMFTLVILSTWMHHERFQVQHSNPAWFIPIVGNILVPIAGMPLGYNEVSWFYFSLGLMMWPPLLAVLFNRFFFHPMLPAKLLPTLFILIAPPAVGFVSWLKLHHGVLDDMGRILYYFALFMTLLLFSQWRHFVRLSFALPWWAYSFPMAAITVASSLMLEKTGARFFAILTPVLMSLLGLLILTLLGKTIAAMRRGEICVPE